MPPATLITHADLRDQTLDTPRPPAQRRSRRPWLLGLLAVGGLGVAGMWLLGGGQAAPPQHAGPPPPAVTVANPLAASVAPQAAFLGQFSAVDDVSLRAQVGGTLATIAFADGAIVQKGAPLFTIDPRPYEIRRDQAIASLQTAMAREVLTRVELWRARRLKENDYGTAETVDQRDADEHAALATIDASRANLRDAALDLEFSHITAPFTGRMGAHLVSVGSLVSGSRGGAGNSTELATIVSLDPVHLDFDMSEADYIAYRHAHRGDGTDADVAVSIDGDATVDRHGRLDFLDNAVNRATGTIHARATVPNADMAITPGQFARLTVTTGGARAVLLIPADAVVPDQAQEAVMTLGDDDIVVPKPVTTGALHDGLRIVQSGLSPTDRIIIGGLVHVRPGIKVVPSAGRIQPPPAG